LNHRKNMKSELRGLMPRMPTENPELLIVTKQTADPAAPNRSSLVNMAVTVYTRCCSWLHRLELLRQAQEKDGNSGH